VVVYSCEAVVAEHIYLASQNFFAQNYFVAVHFLAQHRSSYCFRYAVLECIAEHRFSAALNNFLLAVRSYSNQFDWVAVAFVACYSIYQVERYAILQVRCRCFAEQMV